LLRGQRRYLRQHGLLPVGQISQKTFTLCVVITGHISP
jgi:hypothetical protein